MKQNKSYFLIIILLIGVAVRILAFNRELYIGLDGSSYMRLGKNLFDYGRYSFGENYNWGIFFAPGYPAMIGLANMIFKDLFVSAKLISIFFSIATILLFYFIGKRLYNEESGLFASFAFAVHPSMIEVSSRVATESLFFFIMFLAVYVYLCEIGKNNVRYYIISGSLIAVASLIRPEGLFLLTLPILYLTDYKVQRIQRHFVMTGATLLVFLLIISPYVVFIKNSTGRYGLSGKAIYLPVLMEAGVRSEEVEYDKAAYSLDYDKTHLTAFNADNYSGVSIFGYILENPLSFLRGYIINLKTAVRALVRISIPVMIPLLMLVFCKDLFSDRRKFILIILAVIYFISYPSFFILEKLMFPSLLCVLLLSSVGFAQSHNYLSDIFNRYGMKNNIMTSFLKENIKCLIIVICIIGSFKPEAYSKKEFPVEHRKAGLFLKNMVSSEYEKLNVMHRTPWVSFYSGARYTMLPYANSSDVVNFAKRYHVDYVVIDERSSVFEWEMYNELINMDKYSDEVDLVYEDNSEKLIRMFKVKY